MLDRKLNKLIVIKYSSKRDNPFMEELFNNINQN